MREVTSRNSLQTLPVVSKSTDSQFSMKSESQMHFNPINHSRSVYDIEDSPRLYHTKSDTKRIRALKSLKVLPPSPASITFADVGVQVSMFNEEKCMRMIKELKIQVKELVTLFKEIHLFNYKKGDKLELLGETVSGCANVHRALDNNLLETEYLFAKTRNVLEETTKESNLFKMDFEHAINQQKYWKSKATGLESNLNDLMKNIRQLEMENQELGANLEKSEIEVAFIQQEKDDLVSSLNDKDTLITKLSSDLQKVTSRKNEYKRCFLETRIRSSEVVTGYMNQLADAFEEKRLLLQKSITNKDIKRQLITTDKYLHGEAEKLKLSEQLEDQDMRIVEQLLHIEQLQEQVTNLSKQLGVDETYSLDTETSLMSLSLNSSFSSVNGCDVLNGPIPASRGTSLQDTSRPNSIKRRTSKKSLAELKSQLAAYETG